MDNCIVTLQQAFETFHNDETPWKDNNLVPVYSTELFTVPGNIHNALIMLAMQESMSTDYNCVLYKRIEKLNDQGRIDLKRQVDAFKGIHISCLDYRKDLVSVTLLAKIHSGTPTPDEEITIKTITDFTSNYVEFFPLPICVCSDPLIEYSIEVKTNTRYPPHLQPVCLDTLVFNSDMRRIVCDKINITRELFDRKLIFGYDIHYVATRVMSGGDMSVGPVPVKDESVQTKDNILI